MKTYPKFVYISLKCIFINTSASVVMRHDHALLFISLFDLCLCTTSVTRRSKIIQPLIGVTSSLLISSWNYERGNLGWAKSCLSQRRQQCDLPGTVQTRTLGRWIMLIKHLGVLFFCKSLTLTGMPSIRFHNTETHEMAVSPLPISPFTSFEDGGEESALIAKEI